MTPSARYVIFGRPLTELVECYRIREMHSTPLRSTHLQKHKAPFLLSRLSNTHRKKIKSLIIFFDKLLQI